MRMVARYVIALAAGFGLAAGTPAGAENLSDAWGIALGVNQGLQAEQVQSLARLYSIRAARAARLPTLRTFNFETFLTASPATRVNLNGTSTSTTAGSSSSASGGGTTAAASVVPLLGAGQRQLPVSVSFASVPIYSGGRITANVAAADQDLASQRSVEYRTALDLKLSVAQAYVGVLRAVKNLEVSRSNVAQLDSFARDTRNRGDQGLAIRSEVLAAEVSLANARLSEIQSRTALESAWATYNRYLCRPLTTVVPLDELTDLPPGADLKVLADEAVRAGEARVPAADGEVDDLTGRAIRNRPELAGLEAQARSLAAQARSTLAAVKPQISFTMAYAFLGAENFTPQGVGAATLVADWTITDGGQSRKKSAALRQQELATLKRRADNAADIALEVRTRWLDLWQARQRIPIARFAIAQARENTNVVTDRYRQQLSTYTEVLDAETRRVQSLNNFYNALYDENLAQFRLRRAVGDL